ncbi:MAG: glycosyltransferase family 4 protein, partial [Firmicutes bacterium]|nr:glycosyltransferase family 4 protein [Bacillota bacterium]
MKVMMLSWEYPPNQVGGLAKHVYYLSHSLSQEGTQVAVVTLGGHGTAPRESEDNLEVVRTVPYFSNAPDFTTWVMHANFGLLEAGLGLTREWGEPDIIHAHDWLVVYAGKALKNLLRIPLAATIHATEHGRNSGIHNPTQKYISDMEWWLTYESWRVVCCSHYMREELQRVFNLPGDKIRVIPNGVNLPAVGSVGGTVRGAAGGIVTATGGTVIGTARGTAVGGAARSAGRDFFARPKERIIFHVGRQVPEKGGAILLDAFASVL